MNPNNQRKWQALGVSTLAFTVNFAVWTLFSIIGIRIKQELGLNETEFGFLVAMPILSGSLSRLPLGMLTDRFGGRPVFFLQMLAVVIALVGIQYAHNYTQYLIAGFAVGLAGGSFAIGIAYTSAWFDKHQQGTAMGIFGAGNSGAALTNLIVPLLMATYGWETVPLIFAGGMLIVAVLFWVMAKNDPQHIDGPQPHTTIREQLLPLKEARVWRISLYYFFTFGGFLALTLWLPKYYVGEFSLDLKTASFLTLLFTLPTGLVRALGGVLSDIMGARRILWTTFWISLVCLFFLSYPPTTMTIHGISDVIHINVELNQWVFTLLILVLGICMGLGNASLLKLIYDYYPHNMGSVGGLVGVMGGLGGFTLPILFGLVADLTQIRSSCFMLMYGLLASCMVLLHFGIRASEYKQRLRDAYASSFLES